MATPDRRKGQIYLADEHLAAPILASSLCRVAIVVFLVLLTISARIPLRVWRQQMGLLLLFGTLVLLLLLVLPDGIAVSQQPRLPTPEMLSNWPSELKQPESLTALPPVTDYRYDGVNLQIAKVGPINLAINITQRSLRISANNGTRRNYRRP